MHWVFTASAGLILIGCMICAALAFRARNECDDIETSLRRSLGRIAALEAETAVLLAQMQKLRGKLYANRQHESQTEIVDEQTRSFTSVSCENYLVAQRDGPRSDAAKCECDYCNAKRAEREAARARLVPKSPKERADAIEKGRH